MSARASAGLMIFVLQSPESSVPNANTTAMTNVPSATHRMTRFPVGGGLIPTNSPVLLPGIHRESDADRHVEQPEPQRRDIKLPRMRAVPPRQHKCRKQEQDKTAHDQAPETGDRRALGRRLRVRVAH